MTHVRTIYGTQNINFPLIFSLLYKICARWQRKEMKQISESNSKILAQARFIKPFQLAICFALLQELVVCVYEPYSSANYTNTRRDWAFCFMHLGLYRATP